MKNNAKVSKKTCRIKKKQNKKKQKQERLPACERTDKLETMESYYHQGQSRGMSHSRTRHHEEVGRVLF